MPEIRKFKIKKRPTTEEYEQKQISKVEKMQQHDINKEMNDFVADRHLNTEKNNHTLILSKFNDFINSCTKIERARDKFDEEKKDNNTY